MSKRKREGEYHHGNLRQVVMSEALKMIQRHGEESVSLREIAKRAGVTHSAVYRHFKSKQDVLAALAEEGDRMLGESLDRAAASPDERSAFRRLGEAYVLFALQNPAYFRVMFLPSLADPKEFPQLYQSAWAVFERVIKLVREGMEAGLIITGDPVVIATCAWASVHGLANLLLQKQLSADLGADEDPRPLIQTFSGLIETGILKR